MQRLDLPPESLTSITLYLLRKKFLQDNFHQIMNYSFTNLPLRFSHYLIFYHIMSSQQKKVCLRIFFEKCNNFFFTNKFLFESTNIKDVIIYFFK